MIASSGKNGRRVSGGYVSSLAGYDGEWEYMIDNSIRVTAFNPGFGGGTLANFRGELAGIVSLNLNEVGKFTMAIPVEYYQTYEQGRAGSPNFSVDVRSFSFPPRCCCCVRRPDRSPA